MMTDEVSEDDMLYSEWKKDTECWYYEEIPTTPDYYMIRDHTIFIDHLDGNYIYFYDPPYIDSEDEGLEELYKAYESYISE